MGIEKVKDARGRLDVVAYRTTERLIQELESYWGCPGLWNMCKPYVESGIEDLKVKKVPLPLVDALGKLLEAKKNAG